MTAHTPGPWNVEQGMAGVSPIIQIVSPFGAIASVYGAKNPDDETLPNAKVLAAAPELLEAATKLVESLADMPRYLRANGHPTLADLAAERIDALALAVTEAQ